MTVAISTREHGVVDLSGLPHPARVRDSLLSATSHLPEEVFRLNRRGQLCAKGFVGLVQAGGVTIEILPKVPAGDRAADADFLLRLLVAAGLVPNRLVTDGRVARAQVPLLGVVIRDAAEQLQRLLGEHGPPRRYCEIREDSATVIGRIDTTRLMRQLPPDRHRVPIVHAPLQADNPLSRLLKALAVELERISQSRRTRTMLADAASRLGAASDVPLESRLVADADPTAVEDCWRPLYELAAGLCTGFHPDPTRPGGARTRILLFSLDDVFERILRRAIPAALADSGLALARRTRNFHYLKDLETGSRRLRLRPDLLIVDGDPAGPPVLVADAKWKTLVVGPRGPRLQPPDVYQISAYMNRYRLPVGVLVMPADGTQRRAGDEPWFRRLRIEGSDNLLAVAAIDVPALLSRSADERRRALTQLRTALVDHAVIARARLAAAAAGP